MDVESVETFLAVIETGTVTGAAARLHVTQATVSKRMGALEDELGYKLIERRRGVRSVTVTVRGEQFEPLARQWLSIARDMKALGAGDNRSEFNVATAATVGIFALGDAFRSFACKHPDVRFGMETHHTDEVCDLVERRIFDVGYAFAPSPHGDLVSKPVYREQMMVLTPQGSGLSDAVEPSQLNASAEIHLKLGDSYESWNERYWPRGGYRISVAPAFLVSDYLGDPGSWALVPQSVAHEYRERFGFEAHRLAVEAPSLLCYQIEPRRLSHNASHFIRLLEAEVRLVVAATDGLDPFEPWMLGDVNTVERMR